ncbi:flagellin [Rhodococcus sp. X156]|uniref:flagellin N-terminal helical domain-containing protein n=1 Tax=Rhodococcus sp. X156 TaxID=2499145 RepID=UPI000FD78010|nr:flagellin [Rhodococcus sp. X156]
MSLRINTNTAALNAYGNLQANQAKQQNAFEKLSSGLRINRAADDAAGLSISQGLTSQINGLTQATRNAQDGINVAQIADGALATVQTILQRQRDLTVQASNGGSMDDNARDAISAEIGKLNKQLDNINQTTAFGGKQLFDDATNTYDGTFQVGANGTANERITLALGSFDAETLKTAPAAGGTTGGIDVSSTTAAQGSIEIIDAAIKTVSAARSDIGATQNQLSYTMTNLQTTIQNVSASRSNITDADLATEVSNMSQAQILTQAATSVLAQANSAPQAILKLLQ